MKRAALADLENAYLLLLANHGELTNLSFAQARDALNLDGGATDGAGGFSDDRSRTMACNGRLLEAQSLVRAALAKLGVDERGELRSLMLPSALLDRLGGVFDAILLAQEVANVDANRAVAVRVQTVHDAIRSSDSELASAPALPSFTAAPDPEDKLDRVGNAVGFLTGQHPRFWPASKWAVTVLGLVVVVAGCVLSIVYR